MSDKEFGQREDGGGEASASPDNVIDLETALERRDRDIDHLRASLSKEQRLANNLRTKIGRIDTEICDLGDGLIDRLGTCRDLQAVLAEQKAIETASGADREDHDLPALQSQTEERTLLLREYRKKLDELNDQRDRLRDQLAEIDRLAATCQLGDKADRRSELCSLDELMAETVVLTEKDREEVGLDTEDTAVQRQAAGPLADMVAPEALLSREVFEPATDGRRGTLIVALQGGHHFRYPVFDREITIGRSARNDIQINNEYVSRTHARIRVDETGFVIEDVSSMNGILVDAQAVKRHVFETGDVVVLGTTQLMFEAADRD